MKAVSVSKETTPVAQTAAQVLIRNAWGQSFQLSGNRSTQFAHEEIFGSYFSLENTLMYFLKCAIVSLLVRLK